jgi:hypothetical protein
MMTDNDDNLNDDSGRQRPVRVCVSIFIDYYIYICIFVEEFRPKKT